MLGCGTEVTKGSAAEGSTGLRIVALIHLGIAEFEENPCTRNLPALFVFEGTCGVGYGLRPVSELIVSFGKAVEGFSVVVIVAQRAVKQLNCAAEIPFFNLGRTHKGEVVACCIACLIGYFGAVLRSTNLNGLVKKLNGTFEVVSSSLNQAKLIIRVWVVGVAFERHTVDFFRAVVIIRVKLCISPLQHYNKRVTGNLLCYAGVAQLGGQIVGFIEIGNSLLKVSGLIACACNLYLNCRNLSFSALADIICITTGLPGNAAGLLKFIESLRKLTCPKQFLCSIKSFYSCGAVLSKTYICG